MSAIALDVPHEEEAELPKKRKMFEECGVARKEEREKTYITDGDDKSCSDTLLE